MSSFKLMVENRRVLTDEEVQHLREQVGFDPDDQVAERAANRQELRDPGNDARDAAKQLRHHPRPHPG